MNKKEITIILEDIGLTPAEITVYVSLLDGAQSVQDVIRATDEKRPTVYYSLNSLGKRGLVSKTGRDYGNKFQVESLDKLLELVQRNIRKQNELLEKTKKLRDYYPENKDTGKTLVSYFDNLEAIKVTIFYSLYSKDKTIRTIVPTKNFFHEMGADFVEEYVKEKTKRKIHTVALWEDIPSEKTIDDFYVNAEIKQLPIDMHNSFETTVFIYDDKTLYVSPKKDKYAVLIQSRAHSKMMRSMFDSIWSNSLNIK